jgi:hypothetical protein
MDEKEELLPKPPYKDPFVWFLAALVLTVVLVLPIRHCWQGRKAPGPVASASSAPSAAPSASTTPAPATSASSEPGDPCPDAKPVLDLEPVLGRYELAGGFLRLYGRDWAQKDKEFAGKPWPYQPYPYHLELKDGDDLIGCNFFPEVRERGGGQWRVAHCRVPKMKDLGDVLYFTKMRLSLACGDLCVLVDAASTHKGFQACVARKK